MASRVTENSPLINALLREALRENGIQEDNIESDLLERVTNAYQSQSRNTHPTLDELRFPYGPEQPHTLGWVKNSGEKQTIKCIKSDNQQVVLDIMPRRWVSEIIRTDSSYPNAEKEALYRYTIIFGIREHFRGKFEYRIDEKTKVLTVYTLNGTLVDGDSKSIRIHIERKYNHDLQRLQYKRAEVKVWEPLKWERVLGTETCCCGCFRMPITNYEKYRLIEEYKENVNEFIKYWPELVKYLFIPKPSKDFLLRARKDIPKIYAEIFKEAVEIQNKFGFTNIRPSPDSYNFI